MEWTGARYADAPTIEQRIRIDAPPDRVWELVSDINLLPSLSAELQAVEWLDDGPALGARFRGRNTHPSFGNWETVSHVVGYEPQRTFAWAVTDPEKPSASWRFSLEPHDGGTELRQWMQMGPGPSGLSAAIQRMPEKEQKIVFVRLRELENAILANLDAIKKLAEG
ncbi:SRPBCC family protein [Amycolatopsis albispora]|uniref:Cyclase n=1 Tax=Amycolatopsis albispora TaxID=1804986 RepID=A0A344L3Q5_9PSEU|nr:SRPBCC family protein [Amycolatopsis albispora]AXB42679.1 cyclase [Amycolatopsis albispora]